MEKLEILFTEIDDGFLLKLRMHDVFDDEQFDQIKNELSTLLNGYKDQEVIPKFLLPLMTDVFLVLDAQAVHSRNSGKIHMAIDELSTIIRDKLIA